MAAITAAMVKELRDKTGAGMMDCKKALTECDADVEKALDWLRQKGLSKAAKRADRATSEGVIASCPAADGKTSTIVEVMTETDFVARGDKFQEFAYPIMKNLGFPTIFCHNLEVENDMIKGYHLRLNDQKTKVVKHLQDLNFKVFASGDSFNDTGMLKQADKGCFFCAPDSIVAQFPQLESTKTYAELLEKFHQFQATL